MMRKPSLRVVFLFLFAMMLGAVQARAQTTGKIRGTVKDPSNAVIPAAQISVTLIGTDASHTIQTNNDGDYEFPALPVGHYSLAVEAPGFKKFVVKDVAVDIGQVVVINALLELGTAQQTVTVDAVAPQVETTSTQLGAVMNDVALRQLPLNSRDTYQLLQLQPGVQSQLGSNLFYGSDQPGVVSVNGGRGRSNNYMVNGGDANDIFVNLPAVQPSPDAIEEFRVITNTFDAEYGRNSGAVVNVVTKSGTNEFHGDVFEFFRNKVLNARGYLNSEKPDSKQNQFGGTLGGPILKDRTFFFTSYEGRRARQGIPTDVVTVPTSDERNGIFDPTAPFLGTLTDNTVATILSNRSQGNCNTDTMAANGGIPITAGASYATLWPTNAIPKSCFDPVAASLLGFVPVPPPGTNKVQVTPVERDRNDQFTIRIDHKISSSQQFSAYYYFTDLDQFQPISFFQLGGANLPGFGDFNATRVQQLNLSHTWLLGATAVNEFRFSYFREGQGKLNHPEKSQPVIDSCGSAAAASCFTGTPDSMLVDSNGNPIASNPKLGITPNLPGHEGVPFISVGGGFTIGTNFEGELPQIGNTFQWSDNYSKVFGKHSLKFGGDVRRMRFDQQLFFDVNGDYTFSGGGTNDVGFSNLFPNYLLGLPDSFLQGGSQQERVRSTALYLFAQDSWKIKPNVTLNYGLRWEFTSPIADIGKRVQTFRPGQADTLFPCLLSGQNAFNLGFNSDGTTPVPCGPGTAAESVFPLGLVVPGDKGVPTGLTQTYYKAFAPRIGLAWSPGFKDGFLGKVFGGPGKSSIRVGWGIFYNPVEQLVLEQFSAEPPFGGSSFLFETLFNTPFVTQSGSVLPNPFNGVLSPKPGQSVDWSAFRPILLFGQMQPNIRTQYSEQYNFTVQREIAKDLLFQIGYVGSQAHRLLATHDLNPANPRTCLDLHNLFLTGNSAYANIDCGPFASDAGFGFVLQPGDILHLPSGQLVQGGPGGTSIGMVGTRPFSSPLCDPLNGFDPNANGGAGAFINGCPPDGTPVFSSIFAQDTIANSNYNSLQVLVDKRFSKGLQLRGAYTFSKSIDQASSFEGLLNPTDFRATRSLSQFDARHRFVLSYYWELPVPKHEGFAGKALNGWALSGIYTYQTGFPIRIGISSSSILSSNDQELFNSFDFETAGEPNLIAAFHTTDPRGTTCAFGTGPNAGPNNPNAPGPPPPCDPINAAFDPNIFTNQDLGTIGNAPRTICCGSPINNFDLGIMKATSITEKLRTEFRAEFFNALNHTQFPNPDGNIADGSDFGRVKRTRDPRAIQFALKLIF